MVYKLHLRSQRAKGTAPRRGPDTYVAVTISPEGVEVPYRLAKDVLDKRGIQIKYFGEGYRKYRGPGSSLGRAIAEAEEFIRQNQG